MGSTFVQTIRCREEDRESMTAKKQVDSSVSQEDNAQIQRLLEQRHEIAEALHSSTSRAQAETALAEFKKIDETGQLALLKALAKQRDTDAADILLAINELTPNKAVRKESRRALIQLAGAKIYPAWTPEPEPGLTALAVANLPRFWKGFVSEKREEGEIELVLCWEQGFEYGEARMMVFRLDFWQEGIKDFWMDVGSKRRIDTRVQELNEKFASTSETKMTDCTLAEGRRLIQEALSVNSWRGTSPHKDYRHYLPTVQQLVLNAPDVGVDRGRTFIKPGLEPDEVGANFIGGWSLGDFGLCFDLLASTSPLREGLSRDEWVDLRRKWADEAHPARFEPRFMRERELSQQSIWLPSSYLSDRFSLQREAEMGWSLELTDTPLSGTLPEMPMGTAVYKETRRHWFWTSYTLVQEEGEWRIQRMTDEGARAQGLSIAELQQRIREHDDRVHEIVETHRPTDPDAQQYYEEIVWRGIQALHYDDALLVKLSLDRMIYDEAFSRARGLGLSERAIVYLEGIVQRFPKDHDIGKILLNLGASQADLAEQYEHPGMTERSRRFSELAEANVRKSIKADNAPLGHIMLAELLMARDQEEEAIAELQIARSLTGNKDEEALIEFDLASIAMVEEKYDEALSHFKRVAEIKPDYEGIWLNIGLAYRGQQNLVDAEVHFRRALEANPKDLAAYGELITLYISTRQLTKAYETAEQGLRYYPDSAMLHALLAAIYLDKGDRRRAQAELEEAERINPDLDIVQSVRDMVHARRKS
jgi:tetratricopeptide (TPR) repeat protein